MKKLKLLLSLSVALGLVGCSPGASEHRKLCKKDAGTVIYKQVEADGFYHAQCSSSCWVQFLDMYERTGISYMEFNNERTYSTAYIPEKGYWRYFIADKGNKFCNVKITKKIDSYSSPDDFIKQFRENKCVAAKSIKSPTAKYFYEDNNRVITVGNLFGTTINKVELVIKDRDENIYSKTTQYIKDVVPGTPHEGGSKGCKVYAYPILGNLYEQTIVPSSK
ncbi:hypothetical protein [Kangiella sp. M94]